MLKTDVNSALILFLETLQKAGGMDVLSPMFADMEENGSRAISALSTLATHIDEVKAQQREANKAFQEGTSVTKEFEVQNNTVQASIEKAKNALNDIRIELGQHVAPLMSNIISSSTALIRVLVSVVKFVLDNKTAILALTVGIIAYNVAAQRAAILTAANAVQTKLFNAFMAAQRLVVIAVAGVWSLLTGNITRATASFKLFSAAIKANPIGLFVSIIATALTALSGWIMKNKEAKKAEAELAKQREEQAAEFRKQVNDTSKASSDYAKTELDRLAKLYKATQDQTKSQKERFAAVAELQKTYPTAFGNLSKEEILAGKAASAYRDLAQSIIKAARAKAAAEKIQENEKLILELELENEDINEQIDADAKMLDKAKTNQRIVNREAANDGALNITGPSVKLRAEIKAADAIVDKYTKRIDKNSESLENNRLKIDETRKANERLAKKVGDPSKIAPDITFSGGVTDVPSGTGYTSQAKAEKDAKKAAAAKRAAEVKARKEFKEQLSQIKAARDDEQAQILALRQLGEINYLEYNKRKIAADKKYYNDSIALYEEWSLQEDDECKALIKKREEYLAEANEKRLALNVKAIKRTADVEERDLKARYASKNSHTLAEELELEEKLLKIRYNALMDQQSLYDAGSKEYEEYQQKIDDLFLEDQESKQKKIMAKIAEFQEKYDYDSIKLKYDMERAALKELYDRKKITEEKYREWLKKLDEEESAEKESSLPGQKPESAKTSGATAEKTYNGEKAKLDAALAAGDIDQEEYEQRLDRIQSKLRDALIAPLRDSKSEWVSLMTTMVDSWMDFADALKDPDGDPLGALGAAIQATSAIATSVMSAVTEYMQAELEIQTAAINKRYDAEIEAAEGNSYRTKKLEKERDKEIENLKKSQSRKQFALQVVTAIAQTAANAIQAYSAGLSIGGIAGLALAPIAAALAVAQGAVQIALIKKQQQAAQASGYSQGGFTRPGAVDEPAGIVHAGEWVASQKLLASPVARPMIEALDYAQRTNTIGSLNSEDVSRSIRATDAIARISESDGSAALMVAALAQNAQAVGTLNDRLQQPLGAIVTVTGEHGINHAQDEYDKYIRNKSPKSKK